VLVELRVLHNTPEAERLGQRIALDPDHGEDAVPVVLHHFFELLRLAELVYRHAAYLSI